ncbi:MAG TPA: hypothetical protein VMB50_03565 [Myxococcales bacterium]|nr:hypothetical protein [Myxococcales bacterium]
MKKHKAEDGAGARWLRHHADGFDRVRRLLGSHRDRDAIGWFSAETTNWRGAYDRVCSNSGRAIEVKNATPLYLSKARSRFSPADMDLRVYLSLEATLDSDRLWRSSLKLGVLAGPPERLIQRILYDYDDDDVHRGLAGFPFHIQCGKNPGELGGSVDCAFDGLDEPRLPGVPLDFFLLLQVARDQFAPDGLAEALVGQEWEAVLRTSSHFVSGAWCRALSKALRPEEFLHRAARLVDWPAVALHHPS